MDGNVNRQMEVEYINTGFPYTVTETYMDFFNGIPHQPPHYPHSGPMHNQQNAYRAMNMNSYKYGNVIPYYDPYEVNNYVARMDLNRSVGEYPVMMNVTEQPASADAEDSLPNMQVIPEECSSPNDESPSSSSQVVWQDEFDPDSMTYEELLDLGEAIGAQSRGLSQQLIDSLPTTRYKSGLNFFLRKKSRDRCVICQMRYKIGEKQINLPCKHVYHTDCGSKWLTINKTCPICNVEVVGGEESSQQH